MPGPQKIPRPPHWRAGSPPPWETGEWAVPNPVALSVVVATLKRVGLDRIPADHQEAWLGTKLNARQRRAADIAQRSPNPTSAVLVPFFSGEDGEARMILTRRSRRLRSHTGEVAFPGGMVDRGETPADACLREAKEEVGLDPSLVTLVGHLEAMPTVASGTWIVPLVGTLTARPDLTPSPDEVERIFDVSIADLTAPGVYREEIWEFPGFGEGSVSFFELDGDTVWGATARMLRGLLDLLASGDLDGGDP